MDNKLSRDDISGGTITISNIGAIGGKFGSPLINLPEVAIIAIGRIKKVPHITDEGTVYPLPVMNVSHIFLIDFLLPQFILNNFFPLCSNWEKT